MSADYQERGAGAIGGERRAGGVQSRKGFDKNKKQKNTQQHAGEIIPPAPPLYGAGNDPCCDILHCYHNLNGGAGD